MNGVHGPSCVVSNDCILRLHGQSYPQTGGKPQFHTLESIHLCMLKRELCMVLKKVEERRGYKEKWEKHLDFKDTKNTGIWIAFGRMFLSDISSQAGDSSGRELLYLVSLDTPHPIKPVVSKITGCKQGWCQIHYCQ